jgi:hypothetical protein
MAVFIDGVRVAHAAHSAVDNNGAGRLVLGRSSAGGGDFQGRMQYVTVHDDVLHLAAFKPLDTPLRPRSGIICLVADEKGVRDLHRNKLEITAH